MELSKVTGSALGQNDIGRVLTPLLSQCLINAQTVEVRTRANCWLTCSSTTCLACRARAVWSGENRTSAY